MLRLSTLLLFLSATTLLQAQTPQPSLPITTLNTRSQLVILDVVVTDTRQNPIHDLKASDFDILEDTAPQQIKSFEEHTAASPPANTDPPLRSPRPGLPGRGLG